jgi:HPt (histidine-containing phosphotransfer) domain-containing protein
MGMDADRKLFDREKALACFGSAAILHKVMQDFMAEAEGMLEQLRQAASAADHRQVRQALHWFRGGLVYLHSQEAENACLQLDEASAQEPMQDLLTPIEQLRDVLQRLRQRLAQEL